MRVWLPGGIGVTRAVQSSDLLRSDAVKAEGCASDAMGGG